MTTANSVILPQTPYAALAQIANADTSSLKAVVTGGAAATKVAGLVASNTDASNSYTLQLVYNQGGSNSSGTVTGGTNYLLGSSNLPISAGNVSAAPPVNLLASASIPGLPVDATGAPYLYVNSGDFLCVAVTGTVASGKLVSVVGAAADY